MELRGFLVRKPCKELFIKTAELLDKTLKTLKDFGVVIGPNIPVTTPDTEKRKV